MSDSSRICATQGLQSLCNSRSAKLVQLGDIYFDFLPVAVSFLNDGKSRPEAWEAHRQSLLDSAEFHLLNELKEGAEESKNRGDNNLFRRFDVFQGIVEEMMGMIYRAKRVEGRSRAEDEPVESQHANNRTNNDRSSTGFPTYSDSWASPDVEVVPDGEPLSKSMQSLSLRAKDATHSAASAQTIRDVERQRQQAQRHQRELDSLDSFERRYYDVYRLEVNSLLGTGGFSAPKDWLAQQEQLIRRLEQHLLDRIAGASWDTLDNFDTDRLSRLRSAVNESIARLEGAGMALRSRIDRSGKEDHHNDHARKADKGQKKSQGEEEDPEQTHQPRSQKNAGRSSDKTADAVLTTLRQGFQDSQGSKSGSKLNKSPAQHEVKIKHHSWTSDIEHLENLRALWFDVLQPQLKSFVFNLPNDAQAVLKRRDVLYEVIEEHIMSQVLARDWVERSDAFVQRRDSFFNLVAEQQTAMLVLCAEHLCDIKTASMRR